MATSFNLFKEKVMKLSKWKYEVIVVGLALVIGLGVWWYVATEPQRKVKAEIKVMIDFVQRQALEIAIIENSSKLAGYRQQLAAKKPKPLVNPFAPKPPNPVPVKDPKSAE